ncbi:PH domain-containing protein [Streptomyces sp. MMG1533]|uniref:PH domain-containing protein n=1 Tax=Streptomyces sp. MMG1533 TaxID=1415546 RepID=UPI0006AED3C7|nr:PH domain-containing protein [Streptomyces sp. MMG1533]
MSDGSGVSGGVEREYGRRGSMPRSWFVLLGLLALNGVYQLTRSTSLPAWVKPAMAALTVLLVVCGVRHHRRARTFVGAEGIAVRLGVGVRRRAWHQVYDIRVEANPYRNGMFQPQQLTYLYDTDGRRMLLPHLDDLQLEAVNTEVTELRAVVARHRGMAWDRRPEVEARILRRAGHRRAWWRAYAGAFVVFFGMLAVLIIQLITGEQPRPALLLLCIPLASFAALAAFLNWRWESQVPPHLRET